MRIRFQLAFDALRYSFTFTPVVLALLGLGLAFATLELDQQVAQVSASRSILFYTGGVDSARSVLSTVAASVLSVAALAFSICITALALAAGQFGSRLLHNFLDDGAFQWTLGIFAATFLFCLIVLRSTRGAEDGGVFVPQLSISIALLLTVICVLLLCFFLNHVARSIQAPYVCADAAKDLHREIERLFSVVQRQRGRENQTAPLAAPDFSSATPILGTRDGYVKVINTDLLLDLARRENLVFEMQIRPGQFAFRGEPLLRVLRLENAPTTPNTMELEKNVRGAVVLGRSRSALQDPEYGIHQLVEIAVRALSPAINDPFTARTCLDHLGAALRHVLRLELPSPLLCDAKGDLRLVTRAWSFGGLCDAAFNMIRQYGRDSASVSIHLLETLEKVAHACEGEAERAVIAHHAKMTHRECQAEIDGISDKNDVESRFSRVMAALENGDGASTRRPLPAPPYEGGAGAGSHAQDSQPEPTIMTQIFNRAEEKTKRQALRNALTPAEVTLWQQLRAKKLGGHKFRRQHSIEQFVVDFYCPALKLAVELDGDSHHGDEAVARDAERQTQIEALGVHFLRFSNLEIHDSLEAVCEAILERCSKLISSFPMKPSLECSKFSVVSAVASPLDLHEKLHEIFGFGEFRHLQEEAIRAALDNRDCLVVMPTGAGKSLTFQLPSAISEGVTVVISPLIALMRDQIIGLRDKTSFDEVGAAYLNSSQSQAEQRDILTLVYAGKIKLLYVAPERLRSGAFLDTLRAAKLARFVVDEAHCISEWGHDFRPDYLNIKSFLEQIGHPPTFAVTATATKRVQDSIIHNLGMRNPEVFVGGFNRPNLHFSVVKSKNDLERGNKLFKALPKLLSRGGSGLIYVSTRKQCDSVAEIAAQALAPLGKRVGIYHAGMDNSLRSSMQEAWLRGTIPLLVATNAFGMGIDKPDVRFVIHWGFPESPEAYYQEAGRAGRDGKKARAVILASLTGDKRLREFFIENEAIAVADFQNVVKKLAKLGTDELRIPRFWWDQEFGWREPKPRVIVGKLERAGLLEKRGEDQDGSILRVLQKEIPFAQMRKLAADLELEKGSRYERLDEMLGYIRTSGCRRRVMLDYFGDDEPFDNSFCCDNCDAGEGGVQSVKAEMPDGSVAPPKTLETIHDLLQGLDNLYPPVGKARLSKILRGSRAADVEKFFKSPVFGVCSGVSVAKLTEWLDDLIARGWLHQGDEEDYYVCRITRAGREVWQLRGEIDLEIPGRKRVKTASATVKDAASPRLEEDEDETFERLRAWRRKLADEEHVPPYVIFSDKVLHEIARQGPENLDDLSGVSGVGPAKLEKYGAGILDALNT